MRTILLTAAALGLVFPAVAGDPSGPAEEVRYVMGTLATVRTWADDAVAEARSLAVAFGAFDRVDSLMSTWRDDSALAALNRAPAGMWVAVGAEVCGVLTGALAVAQASDGAFDPTVLPLVELWGFRSEGQAGRPDSTALRACLAQVDFRQVELDTAGGRARLLRPGMAVDLGGIAKGYALDQAAAAMRAAGATGGYLDLGGNILVFGNQPSPCVGVVDPGNRERVLAAIPVQDQSVATSGQYERYLVLDGEAYGHILDPRTGWPIRPGFSVTVLSSSAMLADAMATAAVVLGPRAGWEFLENTAGVEALTLQEPPDAAVRWRTTSGLEPAPEPGAIPR